jgi:uncharacterized repeat protein (TIGR01451 family)
MYTSTVQKLLGFFTVLILLAFSFSFQNISVHADSDLIITKKALNLTQNASGTYELDVNADIGDRLSFEITYENQSVNQMDNVLIKDILPSGMSYVDGSCTGGCTRIDDTPKAGVTNLVWTVDPLLGTGSGSNTGTVYFEADVISNSITNLSILTSDENPGIIMSSADVVLNNDSLVDDKATGRLYFISMDDETVQYDNKTEYNTNYSRTQKFKDGKVTLVMDQLADSEGNPMTSGTCTFSLIRHPRPFNTSNVLREYTAPIGTDSKCQYDFPASEQTVNYYHVVGKATVDGTQDKTYNESRILVLYVGGV